MGMVVVNCSTICWLYVAGLRLAKIGQPGLGSDRCGLERVLGTRRCHSRSSRPPIAFDWYRGFIQFLLDSGSYTWFAKFIVAGELLLGIALILGAFVGIAAFFAGFMNWNFMMAGAASTNPVLFTLSILLILAWKTAGWWGLDRWLLPRLGTPWRPLYSSAQDGASIMKEALR